MSEKLNIGDAHWRRFFYREITSDLSLTTLFQEAYILVKSIGLSYSDVKKMTRFERLTFIKLFLEEQERIKNASK